MNNTTFWSSVTIVGSDGCAEKYIYVDALSASFSLHYYVALLYYDSISHYHIILAVQ